MQTISPRLIEILACPVCKSDVDLKHGKLFCRTCDLEFPIIDGIPIMFSSKLMTKDLKLTLKKWDELYKEYQDLTKVNLTDDPELKADYAHVKKYIKKGGGLFLDAGCGFSKLSCLFAKDGIKVVGIDLSLNGLILTNKLFRREGTDGFFVCGSILEMPFKNDVFSFVYTGGVLEHFKDIQKAVNEIYRCLSVKGFTTNTIPYASLSTLYRILRWGNIPDIFLIKNVIEFVEIKILKGKRMRFGYEKSFTVGKIRKVFANAGFKNIEINLFEAYYILEVVKSILFKRLVRNILNNKLFWPMIYVNGEKG